MKKIIKAIGYVGLSHLGLNYLAAAAEKRFNVIGYDENENLISNLKRDSNIISEPGLGNLLKKNKKNISFTFNLRDIKNCDLVFISLDIPTNKDNRSDLNKINNLIFRLKKVLNKNSNIIILSQVPPGYTQKINWRKKNLYYQVETLIFGKAVNRALNPERIIVGSYKKDLNISKKYFLYLSKFKCPVLQMDYISAELCKISINTFLVSNITTTNLLAELCEKIGASWSSIYPALQLDKRIGKYSYIKPGLGISGGNLERDIKTLTDLSTKLKLSKKIFKNYIENSIQRKNWIYKNLKKFYLNKRNSIKKIGILGLSYKENTDSIKNSPAINLIKKLKKIKVLVYDPKVSNIGFGKNIERKESIKKVLRGIDVLVICTPWPEFRKIKTNQLVRNVKRKIIIDPFQIFNKDKLREKGFLYKSLGEN